MGVEIERKFLVASQLWKAGAEGVHYQQGYLCRGRGRTVRVRTAGQNAFLTIKGPSSGASRAEFEYPIPLEDAQEMLRLCEGALIDKTRYRVRFEGHTWEVDEFHGDNTGLVLAEVELSQEDEHVSIPPWIGEEVTADPRYFNSNLSIHPFKAWLE
jgi:CYTH domain-containing protein